MEHPIFTSRNEQDWYVDDQGNRLHWPVDHYQSEGVRTTSFLAADVIKYHRTISTYMNNLIEAGFVIKAIKEPMPSDEMLKHDPLMQDENRRPMFLIISAEKRQLDEAYNARPNCDTSTMTVGMRGYIHQ